MLKITGPQEDILIEALDLWGAEDQVWQALEEMGELIVKLNHYRRDRSNINEIAEEIADVYIMMQQLRLIFNADDFTQKIVDSKLTRLKDRIQKAKQKLEDV